MHNLNQKIIYALCFLLPSFANAQTLPTTPLPGAVESIGSYSSGCIIGAEAMSLDSDGIHQMRISRGKFWGHSDLTTYLKEVGAQVKAVLGRDLLTSDLGLPRGGPSMSGHVSHQSGLDVDIWFKTIPSRTAVTNTEREKMGAYSVKVGKTGLNTALWTHIDREVAAILALDPKVQRIFVSPIVKKDLCDNSGFPVDILSKFRPWYGHDDHYHVRLHCSADSADCRAQASVPAGDGCNELDWWYEQLENESTGGSTDNRTPQERYRDRLNALPQRCKEVLEL